MVTHPQDAIPTNTSDMEASRKFAEVIDIQEIDGKINEAELLISKDVRGAIGRF